MSIDSTPEENRAPERGQSMWPGIRGYPDPLVTLDSVNEMRHGVAPAASADKLCPQTESHELTLLCLAFVPSSPMLLGAQRKGRTTRPFPV